MTRFSHPRIDNLTPYTPGEQPPIEQDIIKLNTNENPFPPSPKVLETLKRACTQNLRKYPDPNGAQLKHAIAAHYHTPSECLFLGNSSDEVLAHIFNTFFCHQTEQEPLLFADITYSFYQVWCQFFSIPFKAIPLRQDFTVQIEDYQARNRGIIITNPNAPTGLALPIEDIKTLLQHNHDSIVVVDEAYVDFYGYSAASLIEQYDNLIVVQTLSKSRSLAGLRVGFALAQAGLIQALERVKNSFHPFPLDQLAIQGARAAFEDNAYFQQCCQDIVQIRHDSANKLIALGFKVTDSQANFLFVKPPKISAETLFHQLRDRGIYVRHFNQARIKDYLRISIGTSEQMGLLFNAIEEILDSL